MMKLSDLGRHEQCYTHIFEGVVTMLAVARMEKNPEFLALDIVHTPVEEGFARWVVDNRHIEQHRLDRITVEDLFNYPIVYCDWPAPAQIKQETGSDRAHMLVSGHHRYVKAAMIGLVELKARIVPEPLWRKFQVSDITPEMASLVIALPSGIP